MDSKQQRCSFAYPGTYGHDCGRPATLAGSRDSEHTVSGVYWAPRCESCAAEHGGDNRGVTEWVTFDANLHRNEWR